MSKSDDALQTMRLLWRFHTGEKTTTPPGPKPRFDIDHVVTAAIAVADANPSDGVSMRAVAERLGVTAMALYGYVPGKETLVALAYDAIHAEMPDSKRAAEDWRRGVQTWAEDLLDVYAGHPWALRVSYARPVLGPNEQRVLESVISVLRATELDPRLLRRVVGMLFHAVRGTATTIAEAREAEETSELSESEWWRASSDALGAVVPDFADRYPNTMWLLAHPVDAAAPSRGYVEHHALANLRAGLDVLLDGLEVARTANGPGDVSGLR